MKNKIETMMGIILAMVLVLLVITVMPGVCMGIFVSCVIFAVYEAIKATTVNKGSK